MVRIDFCYAKHAEDHSVHLLLSVFYGHDRNDSDVKSTGSNHLDRSSSMALEGEESGDYQLAY